MENRKFTIPADNISNVEDFFLKLNKRGAKLHVKEFTWVWGKAHLNDQDVLMVPLDIEGPFHVFCGDWRFIATLQHLSTGENIIRKVEDIDIPNKYRDAGSDCEHCKVKRYRKDTYLMENKNGAIIQVGSSCLDKFLGTSSPEELMKQAQLVSDLCSYLEGNGQTIQPSGDGSIYPIEKFLAITSAVINDHGWVSKTVAYSSGITSTASIVEYNLHPPDKFNPSKVTSDDIKLAKSALEWVENLSDRECEKSDYLHNIRAIARSGMVGRRTIGFAASIISSYKKWSEDNKPKQKSDHVGEVKQRKEFELTLYYSFPFNGAFGNSIKYLFQDNNGNIFVWNSTSDHDLTKGNHYRIKGTIVRHDEYKGVKQTIINRCEIL